MPAPAPVAVSTARPLAMVHSSMAYFAVFADCTLHDYTP